MWQTTLMIFYLCWLVTVLALLFSIFLMTYRYIHKMEKTMLESRAISAQAALKSAEAAAKLAEVLVKITSLPP